VHAARRGEQLEAVAAGIRQAGRVAVPVVTDLADDESLASLLARASAELGPVDVLVNNAGFGLSKPPEATTVAEWDHTFAVNMRAAAYLCAAVLPGMQARRFGGVINIGSAAGVAIAPGLATYCASKYALGALAGVIQDADHDNGIKAWVICPGFVDTEMGDVVPGEQDRGHQSVGFGAQHIRQRQGQPRQGPARPQLIAHGRPSASMSRTQP
jgi:2-hydroxycyclohexanecarboxyl-CoA dehydrogenase